MQFMTALFGESAGVFLNAAFSLGIVLVLIVLGLWALKAFTRAGETMAGTRRRLVVVESAAVDGKRKLLIVRRDNVEHLILTGGPQDMVLESGIEVADPAQQRATRPAAARTADAESEAEIATPITPQRPVTRDTVDRLHDLVRPGTLRPRTSLRHTNLLRPAGDPDVIPMGPSLRVDNARSGADDSANSGSVDGLSAQSGLGDRNRFFRRVVRDH